MDEKRGVPHKKTDQLLENQLENSRLNYWGKRHFGSNCVYGTVEFVLY